MLSAFKNILVKTPPVLIPWTDSINTEGAEVADEEAKSIQPGANAGNGSRQPHPVDMPGYILKVRPAITA